MSNTSVVSFDGREPVSARRHTNPDGSEGGWVAVGAIVQATVTMAPSAMVYDSAVVTGSVFLGDGACVYDLAEISAGATVEDNARVYGQARVGDMAGLFGPVRVCDRAIIRDNARVQDNARVSGNAIIADAACVAGFAHVSGGTCVRGSMMIEGNSRLSVSGEIWPYGANRIEPASEPIIDHSRQVRQLTPMGDLIRNGTLNFGMGPPPWQQPADPEAAHIPIARGRVLTRANNQEAEDE